jgi:hypothetical protein
MGCTARGQVPISQIEVTKDIKKIDMDDEQNHRLAMSMQEDGQLHPVGLTGGNGSGGKYKLLFGKRRFAAALKLGWEEIDASVFSEMNDEELDCARIAENMYRKGPKNEAERGRLLKRWWDVHVARQGGKTDRQITDASLGRKADGTFSSPVSVSANFALTDEPNAHKKTDAEPESTPFYKKVAEAAGVSERKAKYDVAIAKAFTEMQFDVLERADLTNEWMRRLAALPEEQRNKAVNGIAAGFGPQESYDRATATVASEGRKKLNVRETDNLSDQEWLEQECQEIRQRMADTTIFDIDAVHFRNVRDDLVVLKNCTKADTAKALQDKMYKPFLANFLQVLRIDHPNRWLVCGICSGSRVNQEGKDGPCDACRGAGYKVSYTK